MFLYLIYSEMASEGLMGRMGKPVQRDGEHSASLDCLAISKKALNLKTDLKTFGVVALFNCFEFLRQCRLDEK